VLHPALKKNYFKKLKWPNSWRDKALQLLRKTWRTKYRIVIQSSGDDEQATVATGSPVRNRYSDTLFNAAYTGDEDENEDIDDELERYLDMPVVKLKDRTATFNPLWWWYQNEERYPRLSRMARDYHSIPRKH